MGDERLPVALATDDPDRPLNRLTTFVRLVVAILVTGRIRRGLFDVLQGDGATAGRFSRPTGRRPP